MAVWMCELTTFPELLASYTSWTWFSTQSPSCNVHIDLQFAVNPAVSWPRSFRINPSCRRFDSDISGAVNGGHYLVDCSFQWWYNRKSNNSIVKRTTSDQRTADSWEKIKKTLRVTQWKVKLAKRVLDWLIDWIWTTSAPWLILYHITTKITPKSLHWFSDSFKKSLTLSNIASWLVQTRKTEWRSSLATKIHDCRCNAKFKLKANMHLPDTTHTRVKNFKLDLRLWQMWRENNLHKTPWRGNAGFRFFRRAPSQHDARVDEIWPGKTERRRHHTLAAGRPMVWLLLDKCGSLKKRQNNKHEKMIMC